MIISVTSLKGGTGKSTLSQNLAVCFSHMNYKVCIIDTDENSSSVHWSGLRPDNFPKITVVGLNQAKALRNNINSIHKDYDVIIIDGTPALTELASTIMLIGDIVLIPVKPGVMDVWATEKLLEHYENTKLFKNNSQAYFVLNQVNPITKITKEVEEALDEFDLTVLNSKLHNRIAYSECIKGGIGVYEYDDPKAKNETVSLTNELIELIK